MGYSPIQLAQAFIQTGEIEDALDALNQHLETTPSDDETRRLRVEVLLRFDDEGKHQQALADIAILQALQADDYILQSALHERLSNLDKAIQTAQNGHDVYPDHDRLSERLLYILKVAKRYDDALKIIESLPKAWRWLAWQGDLYSEAHNYTNAISAYTSAVDELESRYKFPKDQPANVLTNDEISEAAGMTIVATYARLLLSRADAYRHTDALDESESDYKSARVFLPNDPVIPFNLGLIAHLHGNHEDALMLCKEALDSAPEILKTHMLTSIKKEGQRFAPLLNQFNE